MGGFRIKLVQNCFFFFADFIRHLRIWKPSEGRNVTFYAPILAGIIYYLGYNQVTSNLVSLEAQNWLDQFAEVGSQAGNHHYVESKRAKVSKILFLLVHWAKVLRFFFLSFLFQILFIWLSFSLLALTVPFCILSSSVQAVRFTFADGQCCFKLSRWKCIRRQSIDERFVVEEILYENCCNDRIGLSHSWGIRWINITNLTRHLRFNNDGIPRNESSVPYRSTVTQFP